MSTQQSSTLETAARDRERLVKAIVELEAGRHAPITDPELACQLAYHLKPHIDRLIGLQQEFSAAAEEAELPFEPLAAKDAGATAQHPAEDKNIRSKRPASKKSVRQRAPREIASMSGPDKARWIFMERFITLEQHQKALGCQFAADDLDRHCQQLERLLQKLLALPAIAPQVKRNDLEALQKFFATTLLLFRSPFIGDPQGHPIPCSIENLRNRYPNYFYKRLKTPNWYEEYAFYTTPLPQAEWALCEMDYLNCTLQTPRTRLKAYAKRWGIPEKNIRQKNVLEDIYDRIVCGQALREHVFEQSCNSCTSTSYKVKEKGPLRLVYTVQRDRKIAIHGKSGLAHWKFSRRLWPGIFPVLVLPSEPRERVDG